MKAWCDCCDKTCGIHLDYGILERWNDKDTENISGIPNKRIYEGENKKTVFSYLEKFTIIKNKNAQKPNLQFFWFAKDTYIDREHINKIVARNEKHPKREYYETATPMQRWLGGDSKNKISKKIFSFHGLAEDTATGKMVQNYPSRCFGYAKKNELEEVIDLIESNVSSLKGKITRGTEVLNEL